MGGGGRGGGGILSRTVVLGELGHFIQNSDRVGGGGRGAWSY